MFKTVIWVYILIGSSFILVSGDSTNSRNEADELENGIQKLRKLSPPYAKIKEEQNFERELYRRIEDNNKYDFIIIGAGAAGATLARRLAEVPQWKILLLEAGDLEDRVTKVPAVSFNLLSSKYNWGYLTSPQKNWCLGSASKQCLLGMGRGLGGSTAINGMLWSRGNVKDYDAWAELGNEGWSFKDVLPYFKKVEDSNVKHFSSEYQGKGGRVHLENTHFDSDAIEYVLRAAHEQGIPYVNYQSNNKLGISHAQGTLKDGKRWSSASAYLDHATPNLVIRTRSRVLKVLIDEVQKKAYGVQYLQNDTLFEVHAKKEVILSAGGMSTPKLLVLSGIGPEIQLERLGIRTLSNLQVGTVLRTHVAFIGLRIIFENSSLPAENEKKNIVDYLRTGKGPLTAFSSNLVAHFRTEESETPDGVPDVELTLSSQRHKSTNGDKLAIGITVVPLYPKSFGSIKVMSSDPLHPPAIDPNLLSDKGGMDMKVMIAGIRIAQKFINTTIFKQHGGHLDTTSVPACRSFLFNSDDYWRCAIQQQTICLSDPTSTAKMGPTSDKDAVVDHNLHVYGIKNLRVVDNSVIPVTIAGHMMAPAYMVGEKGADLIKFFWKDK